MRATRWLLAALVAAPLVAGPALADMKGGRDGDGEGMGKRIAKKLELTQTQQDQLKKLREEHGAAMKPLHEKMREQMKQLHELVAKKASDGELTAALTQVKQTRMTIRDAEDKQHDAMAAVLNPTQRAKMALWMGRQMGERWGKGRKDWKDHEEHGDKEKHGDRDGDDDD